MKINEIIDPSMKMKLEMNKLRLEIEARDETIMKLVKDVSNLKQTLGTLIKRLGPK